MAFKHQCAFVFENKERCTAPIFGNKEYCVNHYRDLVLKEDESSQNEQNIEWEITKKAIPPHVITIGQIKNVLGIAIPNLIWGNVSPDVVTALTRACIAQAKIIEVTELEAKIESLERVIAGDVRFSSRGFENEE